MLFLFQVLVLAGCSRISADGIRAFLDYPKVKQSLLFLDVSRCIRITRSALVLPPTVCVCVCLCVCEYVSDAYASHVLR